LALEGVVFADDFFKLGLLGLLFGRLLRIGFRGRRRLAISKIGGEHGESEFFLLKSKIKGEYLAGQKLPIELNVLGKERKKRW
jgi:hypothetical protein